MDLSRMIRTTKVLVVAFALAMPAGLPARAAESDGFRNVETRTRHVRIKHRTPHHSWRKGHRSITTIGGFSSADSRGLPDVQTAPVMCGQDIHGRDIPGIVTPAAGGIVVP